MSTLLLTQSDVRALVHMEDAVEAVQEAFRAYALREAQMPPKVYLDFPDHHGDLRAMPAALNSIAGLKWVNSHPDNPVRHGLPSVMGLYVLSEAATALPLAVMDATLLTAVRTGAAAAVASRALARADSKTLGIVGCGVQADYLIEAHRVVFPDIDVITADKNPEAAAAVAARWGGRVGTTTEAAGCDIVCTATPSRQPVVHRTAVRPGAHINAMGADAEGKQELDPQILLDAELFVDDWPQASHSGEINVPLHQGTLGQDHVLGSITEVVAGLRPGRTEPDQITVFDSTGLAIQDLALAARLLDAARAAGRGQTIDFRS